jgi:hypothetical protein
VEYRSLTHTHVGYFLNGKPGRTIQTTGEAAMKKILELVLCILHPIAVVLIWINLVFRRDLGLLAKLTWGITSIVPVVPFIYVLTGNDFL